MSMKNYTREDILRLVEEEDVEFIRLQFTDIFGMLKNVAVTASQLEKALDNRYVFDGVIHRRLPTAGAKVGFLKPRRGCGLLPSPSFPGSISGTCVLCRQKPRCR